MKCVFNEDDIKSWNLRTSPLILNETYNEHVVVYYNCGGGIPDSILNHMIFKSNVLDLFYERLQTIPDEYTSFHIRNTDKIAPDLGEFLKKHIDDIKEASFLASDDIHIIKKVKELNTNIVSFANIPEIRQGNNIHYFHESVDQNVFIIDCMVDILLLASAKKYFFSCKASGYSKLANYLHMNLLNKLINKAV